jgi:hypothetical protein
LFSNINFTAFAVSVIVYCEIGGVWFSALYGKALIGLTQLKTAEYNKMGVGRVFADTFLTNIVICLGVANIVNIVQLTDLAAAARLGLTLGIGFMAAPCALNYMSGQRPLKLTVIDAGYHLVAILAVTVMHCLWK